MYSVAQIQNWKAATKREREREGREGGGKRERREDEKGRENAWVISVRVRVL